MEKNDQISNRLNSLDALRGFDMLWIMGVGEFTSHMARITKHPFWLFVSEQLEHVEWNGFHFEDLIFPLFLFIAGVATPFSVYNAEKKGATKRDLFLKILKRGLILILLGIIFNNGINIYKLSEYRFASVLGRIGTAYMLAGFIYLYASKRAQKLWFVSILLGYWIVMKIGHAPGYPMGDLSMEGNFASYVDRLFLPGKLYLGIHDPEGILSTIPAIATGLVGIFTGNYLRSNNHSKYKKALNLLLFGIGFILIAQIWNFLFPINKNLWTSSFVMHCGGLSLVLLSVFYYLIDVLEYNNWSFFFRIIGLNSIFIYMSGWFIDWGYTANFLFAWIAKIAGEPYNVVVISIFIVFTKWLGLFFMYKKKIFIKI